MKIEDYALIGDCESAALVARDGSIDWLCWPRFDSPACFAALLGGPQHGRWKICPAAEKHSSTRRYRGRTLILETDFETAEGAVTVVDFMPVRSRTPHLLRMVVGRRGRVAMHMQLVLRFDYGASVPWVTRLPGGRGIRAIAGPDMAVLRSPVRLEGEDLTTVARFEVGAGDSVAFELEHAPSHQEVPPGIDCRAALARTENYWKRWCEKLKVAGEWGEAVCRSLITLKALTYEPTGGVLAAATTSLPEQIGSVRNWDYRYCWLRDATLTLLALMNAGFHDEARCWREWLLRAVAGAPSQMQIMYGIAGERRLAEWTIDWLPGYAGSAPVRVGNAASAQLQLDVYGEVMDVLHQARRAGLASNGAAWDLQRALLEHLEKVWQEPDEGMWEVRGPRRHFTYSKLMCWVAFDRAVKTVEQFHQEGPVERWRELRSRIHADVCAHGWNPQRGSFVQSYGSEELDASLLLIPLTGFLPCSDPRVQATVAAIQRDLTVDGFVRRYRPRESLDGLPPGEGVFLACSFWLADVLCMLGRWQEARALFKRLVGLVNDVGLLAEEYDPVARRFLGNFPQAFSHVALVNTAMNLTEHAKPAEQRAEKKAA
ncbi:MAG: glycoside hydrolase family 15 protein [Betaproteobacteria bacterium]|nr:MAG: glycoside hydrolase family 15 protein [Betaproteobacteria bacterium]